MTFVFLTLHLIKCMFEEQEEWRILPLSQPLLYMYYILKSNMKWSFERAAAVTQHVHWRSCFSQVHRGKTWGWFVRWGAETQQQGLICVQSQFESLNGGLLLCSLTVPVAQAASGAEWWSFICQRVSLTSSNHETQFQLQQNEFRVTCDSCSFRFSCLIHKQQKLV